MRLPNGFESEEEFYAYCGMRSQSKKPLFKINEVNYLNYSAGIPQIPKRDIDSGGRVLYHIDYMEMQEYFSEIGYPKKTKEADVIEINSKRDLRKVFHLKLPKDISVKLLEFPER